MDHQNNKGFSLIELMIVVAIIGILTTVAVPNFNHFQQKAKQAELKTNLSGYYMAGNAFFAEFEFYAGDFVAYGFNPTGLLNYHYQGGEIAAFPATYTGPTTATCLDTTAATVCTGLTKHWTENAILIHAIATGTPASGATTFSFCGASNLGSTGVDEYCIDNTNTIAMQTSGLL